jgi:hypothetical protein
MPHEEITGKYNELFININNKLHIVTKSLIIGDFLFSGGIILT